MDLKEFQYILKVASTRNISKAASALYISQPALSQYITHIEENLGVKLFNRMSYPISLTPEGELYVSNAKAIMNLYSSMLKDFDEINQLKKGKLRIAASNFRAFCIFPRMVSGFTKLYPYIELELKEAERIEYENVVKNGDVDFAIYPEGPADSKRFDSYYLCKDEIYVVLPPGHPYNLEHASHNSPQNPQSINLSLLKDEHFILLSKNQGMHEMAMELCAQFGFVPKISMQTPLLLTCYSLCMSGLGCTFMYSSFFDGLEPSEKGYAYRIAPIFPKKDIYLIKDKKITSNKDINLFVDYIVNHGLDTGHIPG